MENVDFGIECENCECITCVKNDDTKCQSCNKCTGNQGYSKWKMNCKRYKECKNPDETIKIILGDVL